MRKLLLFLLCLSLVLPIVAQDDTGEEEAQEFDCATLAINDQIDDWYNEYLGDRGEFEVSQATDAAQALADQIDALVAACSDAPNPSLGEDDETETVDSEESGEPVEQTGLGTFDAPFIIQAPGVIGITQVDVVEGILPASDFLIEAGVTSVSTITEDQEYLVVYVSVTCLGGLSENCNINTDAFRAVGDLMTVYEPTLSEFEDYFPRSNPLTGGSERSGAIPFLIDKADTSLRLIYYPEGNAREDGAIGYYFDAQGRANSFEVRATTAELIIRNAPEGSAVSVLRSGQIATASGRNEDASWIYIDAPEGSGWVSADFLTSDSDLMTLAVIEVEE